MFLNFEPNMDAFPLDGKEAKDAWERLRTLFKRNHNKKTSSGQAATYEVKWQFYTALPHLKK